MLTELQQLHALAKGLHARAMAESNADFDNVRLDAIACTLAEVVDKTEAAVQAAERKE